MTHSITRRAMLALLPAAMAGQSSRNRPKSKPLPNVGEFARIVDPTTETTVVRLTSLKSASVLPARANRFVSLKERALMFASDRTTRWAPFQVDLRSGALRQLADPAKLAPESLSLDPKEKSAYWIDGDSLQQIELSKKLQQPETIAEGVKAFSVAPNGALFVIRRGKIERREGESVLSLPVAGEAEFCSAHPSGAGCLYTRQTGPKERELWYTATGAAQAILLAKGAVSDPFWAPDGQTLLFLREVPGTNVTLTEIHEARIDGSGEQCVSPTSQFASFAPNFDGSVFVGASQSKAQPNVVLLLRSVKREMTLCQHRSSAPASVAPVFSPDARRVYFQSDQEGKSAIYSVSVEQLVEPLDASVI